MLSDEALEKLLQPIIDRQEKINKYVVELIAKRIREVGRLSPSDLHRLQRILQMGADVQKVNEEIARQTGLQVADIKEFIRTVALDSYIMAKPYYDYRHKAFIPFKDNKPLMDILNSIEDRTVGTYINMSKSSAFMIRDRAHPKRLMPTPIAETFQTVMDEAVQAVQSGVLDYGTAMRRTLKQLNESGLRYVTYNTESGKLYTQRLDSAVRRNLLDGVRAINQGVQDEIAKQIDSDGKELSVHAISAPDHEPVQGHQFTNEEYDKLQSSLPFKDVKGNHFAAIERHIGQYNCRHFAWAIIVGVDKPNYTDEQLEKFKEANAEGYTLPNGTHLTLYECTQKQREMETKIRRAKEGQMTAMAAGDMALAQEYQAKESQYVKEYRAFSKACGLPVEDNRTSVPGYKRISLK